MASLYCTASSFYDSLRTHDGGSDTNSYKTLEELIPKATSRVRRTQNLYKLDINPYMTNIGLKSHILQLDRNILPLSWSSQVKGV